MVGQMEGLFLSRELAQQPTQGTTNYIIGVFHQLDNFR